MYDFLCHARNPEYEVQGMLDKKIIRILYIRIMV